MHEVSWGLKAQAKQLREQIRKQEELADKAKEENKFAEEKLLRDKIRAAKETEYALNRERIVNESSEAVSNSYFRLTFLYPVNAPRLR